MFSIVASILIVLVTIPMGVMNAVGSSKTISWTDSQRSLLRSMVITNEEFNSPSPSNRWANDERAANFGHKLFFDARLSRFNDVSCASCHQPENYFTDGQPLSRASNKTTLRNTPTIVGASFNTWQFWDGRADSLWSQALDPIESAREHANNRTQVVHRIRTFYLKEYESIFGSMDPLIDYQLPRHASPITEIEEERKNWASMTRMQQQAVNRVFSNIGKAIEAYERKLVPAPSRFDLFVISSLNNHSDEPNLYLSVEEQEGLRLFISEEGGQCVRCHNGPNFSNADFQALAIPVLPRHGGDKGRHVGVDNLAQSEFGCEGPHSDADTSEGHCDEVRFAKREGKELVGAFKVPSLRNVAKTAPYMHGGQLVNLAEVLRYYNRAPVEQGAHSEIEPLRLLPRELKLIETFLYSLNSAVAAESKWLEKPQGT